MIFGSDIEVVKYEKKALEPGLVPGSRVPIRFNEAALVKFKDRDFLALEDEVGSVNVCCVDPRFRHMFLNAPSLSEALALWQAEFKKGGEGL